MANQQPRGSKFLINGEPRKTNSRWPPKARCGWSWLPVEGWRTPPIPELGESAIEKLLDALERLRKLKLPTNPTAGDCTMNIGMIEGGRAPNVIPDKAVAHLLYRLVGPAENLRRQITQAVAW